MRRLFFIISVFLLLLVASGCSGDAGPAVINTFAQTRTEEIEETEEIILRTYSELSDGTWEADGRSYQHRLVITGRLNHAVKDITYTILSNTEDITFEQAWKASGLSSNLNDYFAEEDAVFVAIR